MFNGSNMDRVADVRMSVDLEAPASASLHSLKQRVGDLARDCTEESVDEVRTALLDARREPRLADLIHELLEQHHVQYVRDSRGRTLRFILVDTLLALGFPRALEVTPEDLEYHRTEDPTAGRATVPGGFTVASGVLSLLWSALWSVGLLGHVPAWVTFALLLSTLHALAAMVFATRAVGGNDEVRGGLKALAWSGLLLPVCLALARYAVTPRDAVVAGALLAMPFAATSVLCGVTASRLR